MTTVEEETWDFDADEESADWIKHVVTCPHCGERQSDEFVRCANCKKLMCEGETI